MFSVRLPGPLEEKVETTGAGLKFLISSDARIVAVGFLCKIQNVTKYLEICAFGSTNN